MIGCIKVDNSGSDISSFWHEEDHQDRAKCECTSHGIERDPPITGLNDTTSCIPS
jgi:hypothetical protein